MLPACNAPEYQSGVGYNQGARVQLAGQQYQCLVTGWCGVTTLEGWYKPGSGSSWSEAWQDLGVCGAGGPTVTLQPSTTLVPTSLPTQPPEPTAVPSLPVGYDPIVRPPSDDAPVAADTVFAAVPLEHRGAQHAVVLRDPERTGRASDLCTTKGLDTQGVPTWAEYRAQNPSGPLANGTLLVHDNQLLSSKFNVSAMPSAKMISAGFYEPLCRLNNSMRFAISAQVPAGLQVDSDGNDPYAEPIANDSFAQAQSIAPMGTLLGHLGDSHWGFDGQDIFTAQLYAGQLLQLLVPKDGPGIDIKLLADDKTLVDFAMNANGQAQLLVPERGQYYLVLSLATEQGQQAYSLNLLEADPDRIRPLKEFVLDEVIVEWQVPEVMVSRSGRLQANQEMPSWPQLVELAPVAIPASARNLRQSSQDDDWLLELAATNPKSYQRVSRLRQIRAMNDLPHVASAEPNFIIPVDNQLQAQRDAIQALSAPPLWHDASLYLDEEFADRLWAFPFMNVLEAWEYTQGEGALIAVLDSHMAPHLDLDGAFVDGCNVSARDACQSSYWHADQGGLFNNHGLHIAGTIAARANGAGIVGVAPRSQIMPVQIANSGGATAYDMAQGILYAAGLPNDLGVRPRRAADVINISFGTFVALPTVEQALNQAVEQGVIVVASSGNDNNDNGVQRHYPSSYEATLGVANLQVSGQRWDSSNYGSNVDLGAPGRHIYSLDVKFNTGEPSWEYQTGTSMAAPHAAAVFAMMRVINPELDLAAIRALLQAGELTYRMDGSQGWDPELGWGILDAHKSMQAALAGIGPRVYSAPDRLHLDQGQTEIEFSLLAVDRSFSLQSVVANHPALSVEAVPDQPHRYRVSLDSSLANEAVLATEIQVNLQGEAPLRIPVQALQLRQADYPSQTATLRLLLHDYYGELVAVVPMEETAPGLHQANQDGLPLGYYIVTVSTDLSGDGQDCGFAEICGRPMLNGVPRWFDMTERVHYSLELPLRVQNSQSWQ